MTAEAVSSWTRMTFSQPVVSTFVPSLRPLTGCFTG